jgi:serine/threonine-protein kinase
MAVAACPKPDALAAFARGKLTGPDLAAVAGHVGVCAACCRALELVPDDSLAGLARAAAVAPVTVQSTGTPSSLIPNPNTAANIPPALVGHPRYRVIGELGAGGMGVVYKAEHRVMGRTVALKVVAPNLTARAGAVERFRKEVRAAAQLSHNNIVRAHDAEEAGGLHFLVMEFIEGVSLDRLVAKKGPLPVHLACTFARQAALGLQHAADKGMVHRDIKPQNLMVTRKGQLKILDFGIARFASTDDPEPAPAGRVPFGAGRPPADAGATNPNLLMGTPDYLSPEQAKNSHDVDPRSDVYSLGCTLYFLLTARPPFVGAATLIDKLHAHTYDAPPPVRVLRPEVPEGLVRVLAKMTAKAPDDRYQRAADAAAALLPFTRSEPTEPAFEVVDTPAPRESPVGPRAPATELASDTDPQPGAPTLAEVVRPRKKKRKKSSRPARRKWAVLGGVAALCVLVAGVLAAGKKATPKAEAADAKPTEAAPAAPSPAPAKGGKAGAWTPPTVIAPPKENPKVLYVLPSDGVRFGDYDRVRRRLEAKGAVVATASSDGGRSKPFLDFKGEPGPRAEPVPIDKRLTATADLSEYAAVVFAGHHAEEYMFAGRGSAAAARAVQAMQAAGRPVAGIGLGTGVLVFHGALRGRHAAWCDPLEREFPALLGREYGVVWGDRGVTADGKAVTATGGREADEFADAILKAIEK